MKKIRSIGTIYKRIRSVGTTRDSVKNIAIRDKNNSKDNKDKKLRIYNK